MEVRFAAIPKCASSTLTALTLTGAYTPPFRHPRIRTVPDWEKYHWMAVERPAADWYASYWAELKRAEKMGDPDPFVAALGLRLQNMEEDLAVLQNPPRVALLPRPYGVNGWIPDDFHDRFAEARARGLDFYGFCREFILDGVPCESIAIGDLDAWLLAHGYPAHHLNLREA
jgi:hypothetical protein